MYNTDFKKVKSHSTIVNAIEKVSNEISRDVDSKKHSWWYSHIPNTF